MTREVVRAGTRFRADDCPQLPEFWQMYEAGWEPQTVRVIRDRITPGSVFVDVGAWIGPHSLFAAALGAKVIAVEPDPIAAAMLEVNVAHNDGLPGSISVWKGAVVAETGEEARLSAKGALGDSLSYLSQTGAPVASWTLPAILEAEEIGAAAVALVKIDVEGYEKTLMPILGPWLGERAIPLTVSFHEGKLDRLWFRGYGELQETVEYISPRTSQPWGELTALPDPKGST